MLSLGVRNIFICNRTVSNAQALADHYNKLIEADAIQELYPGNAAHTRVRVLESFDSPWPAEFRHPSMIVSTIPTQTADGSSTNFILNPDWLKSPTAGAVVEVRKYFATIDSARTDKFYSSPTDLWRRLWYDKSAPKPQEGGC